MFVQKIRSSFFLSFLVICNNVGVDGQTMMMATPMVMPMANDDDEDDNEGTTMAMIKMCLYIHA